MIISLDINISNGNRGTVDGVKCRFLFGSHPIISYFSLIALSSSSNSIQLSQPPFTFTSSLPKGIHFFLSFSFFLRSSYFSLSLFFDGCRTWTHVCVREWVYVICPQRFYWTIYMVVSCYYYYYDILFCHEDEDVRVHWAFYNQQPLSRLLSFCSPCRSS